MHSSNNIHLTVSLKHIFFILLICLNTMFSAGTTIEGSQIDDGKQNLLVLDSLSLAYLVSSPEQSIEYGQQTIALAKKLDLPVCP